MTEEVGWVAMEAGMETAMVVAGEAGAGVTSARGHPIDAD